MNILRDILPSAYTVLRQLVSDPIQYKRGAAALIQTTATFMPTAGDEPTQGGNVIKIFMSQAQVGATPPARGDVVIQGGVNYVVNKVEANDYGGYFMVLLKK